MNLKRILPILTLNITLCVVLLAIRILKTDSILFGFLLKNAFLAYLPLLFILIKEYLENLGKMLFSKLFAALCILFLPNSFYIITDLIHLKERAPMPIWFDAILILVFALSGCFAGLLSVKLLLKSIQKYQYLVLAGLYLLMAFGVYLGRFVRWNSWDLFQDPFILMKDIASRFFYPTEHPRTWIFTLIFATLLFTIDRSMNYFGKLVQSEKN